MIYEFALDPNILNNWQDVRYFTSHFGFQHGRVISRFPKKWKMLVYQACASCKTIEKKRIEEHLSRIDEKLIPSLRDYDGTPPKTWIDNAIEQHDLTPFHKIISESNPTQHADILVAGEIYETTDGWNVSTGDIITRKSELIVKCAEPLLRYSKKIVIVDPHIDPFEDRYLETLKVIFDYLTNCEIQKEIIQIHCADNRNQQSWEYLCQNELKPIVPSNISVTLKRWKQSEHTDRLHARYILTEHGGIKFDYGLDKGRNDLETTDVDLIKEKVRARRWNEFVENPIFEPFGDPITLP